MVFNSIEFLFFFPIVVILYFFIPPKYRSIWLLLASYYFYMSWNPKYIILILISTVITYLSGVALERIETCDLMAKMKTNLKKICVFLAFFTNISILVSFKYWDFLVDNVLLAAGKIGITMSIPEFDVVLPVGISFYTFQALSYTVDVYRREIYAERNFYKYALYVSFFPQLVAGPIERSKNLLKQINESHSFNYDRVCDGLKIMTWGLFKKIVIADQIAMIVDEVFGNYQLYSTGIIVLAVVLFALQIYCDFSGYSDIAIGAAKVMGFQLMQNFRQPYFAESIGEFWRRWHISLSTWFRDYLYIPLGGSRCSNVKKYRNLMITFLVSGLWHGASWNFVLWGGCMGCIK